jgi:hypothetical protein
MRHAAHTQLEIERRQRQIVELVRRVRAIPSCYRFHYEECVYTTFDENFAKEHARSETLKMLIRGKGRG